MGSHRLAHNWIIFDEADPSTRYQMIDPESEALGEAAHAARYDLAHLTQSQAYLLCAAVECYQHLGAHPAGTERMVAKLRRLRRAAKEVPRG